MPSLINNKMRNIAIIKSLQLFLSFIFFIVTSMFLEISEYGLFASLIAVTLVIDSVASIRSHEIVNSLPSAKNRGGCVQRQLFLVILANIFFQLLVVALILYTSLVPDLYILPLFFSISNNIRYFSVTHRFLVTRGLNLTLLQFCDSLVRTSALFILILTEITLSAELMLCVYVFATLPGLLINLPSNRGLSYHKIYQVRIQKNVLSKIFYSVLNSGLKSGINSIDVIFLNNLYSLEVIGIYDRFKRIFGVVLGFGDMLSNFFLRDLKERLENKLTIKLFIVKKNIIFSCVYILYCFLVILIFSNNETLANDFITYSDILYAVILFNIVSNLFIWWTKYFSLIYDARLSVIQSVITLVYYSMIMQLVDNAFENFVVSVTSIVIIRAIVWVYQVYKYEKSLSVHI